MKIKEADIMEGRNNRAIDWITLNTFKMFMCSNIAKVLVIVHY